MKTKLKIIIVTVIAIIMLTSGLLFAINYKKDSIQYFYDSGYVINNIYDNSTNNVDKIYFDQDASYTERANDKYSFTNSSGKKELISDENFIHYANGSIMSLKDGVVIDLSEIDSKFIKYYNVFANAIINKSTDGYQIQNLNEIISLKTILFKISDKKYLIGAENIIVSSSDNQTMSMKNYAEIEYINANVIRIYNDEANYQTISSNLFLTVGDTLIDLEYKTINKSNKKYLTMADMVINEDDNIEILPIKPVIESNSDDGENNANSNDGENNTSSITPENEDALNKVITNTPNVDTDEEPAYEQPTFTVESMDVTTLGFENLKIRSNDPSNVLYGNKSVEIIENSTGKVVQAFNEWNDTTLTYSVDAYYSLKTNTEYTLNVTGQYKVEDTVYDRTFVSKMFRTLNIGIEITEDYVTDNLVSFAIYKNSYSDVKSFDYEIVNSKGDLLKSDKAIFNSNNLIKVSITSEDATINANSKYTLNIKNIRYGNEVLSTISYEALKLSYDLKTLKSAPNRDLTLTSSIDDLKNTLNLGIEGISDPNNGVKSYTYNVYNLISNEILYTSKKDSYSNLQVSIDELGQGGIYYFNVEIEFDDNEKTIIYKTLNSNPINTSLLVYPQVVEYESISIDDLNCEELDGRIKINDESDFISNNQISEYKIVIKEKSNPNATLNNQSFEDEINISTYKNNSMLILPVHFSGLKPNTEYVLYTYLNYGDNYVYIGYSNAKTKTPDSIYLTAQDNEETQNELFAFNIELDKDRFSTSTSQMESLRFDLYGCDSDNSCYKLSNYYRTLPKNQNSEELNDLKNEETILITSSEFEFYPINYKTEYETYKVVATAYGNGYQIPVVINGATDPNTINQYELFIIDTKPTVNINVNQIPNSECEVSGSCEYNNTLDDDTIVGFKLDISTIKSTMGYPIQNVYYYIGSYETDCSIDSPDILNASYIKIDMDNSFSKSHYLEIKNSNDLMRGTKYCLYYYGDYSNLKEGKTEHSLTLSTELYANKQPSKINGYISKYTGTSITLRLFDIKDPDLTIKSLYLKDNNDNIINTSLYNGDGNYTFNGLIPGQDYGLFATENIGASERDNKIYNAVLDEVYTITEPKLLVNNRTAGKLVFKLPYNEYGTIYNNFEHPELIAGLTSNNQYLPLTQMENYYQADLNYSDLAAYGLQIENGLINFNNIELVYENGTINETVNNNTFLKSINALDDNKYYNGRLGDFSTISTNSIFQAQYTNNVLTSFKNQSITILKSSYSSLLEDSSIGQLLNSKLIHFNEVKQAKLTLYDEETSEEISSIISNETLSTSAFDVKTTSTGANVKFNITSNVKNNTILKVKLNYNSTSEEAILKYLNSEWTSISNSNKVKISPPNSEINVSFENLRAYNTSEIIDYNYDILYAEDGTTFYPTYNDDLRSLNTNIEVLSLQDLSLRNIKTKYEKAYWNLNSNETNILFLKTLKSTFDIDTSLYMLNNDETIEYDVFLQKVGTDAIQIGTDLLVLDSNIINLDLGAYSLEGTYQVSISPKITQGTSSIALSSKAIGTITVENNNPITSIANYNSPVFQITMDDADGLLVACNSIQDYTGATKVDTANQNSNYVGNQNFYFELYQENSTSPFAYSKIPFNVKSTSVSLENVFYANTDLTSGYYVAKLKYCVGNSTNQLTSTYSLKVYNLGLLNLKILTLLKSYLLKMENPDSNSIDSINWIQYQYILKTSPTPVSKIIGNDDLVYTIDTDKNGIKTYFLELPIDNNLTSNVRSLTINFYDSNNQLITSFSK